MRLVVLTVIIIFLCFLIYEAYVYFNQFKEKQAEYNDINQKVQNAQKTFNDLKSELNYYSQTENLIKELKKQFNYKLPFEKLMILIPESSEVNQTATNSTSSLNQSTSSNQ